VIPFHRVLIATGIVFCGGFAVWALAHYAVEPRPGLLVLAVAFAAFAAGLGYYLAHLRRFIGR
jgi:hypothetical protein